ncbi:MAG: hypothetical protein ACREIT_05040 [Tepidisphaeraceae bacterium]
MTAVPDPITAQDAPATHDIVARASREYRLKRYLMIALLVGWGLWSIYDGFHSWPAMKRDAEAKGQKPPHNDMSILFNKVLGVALPPLGLFMLGWALYHSRGEYRLTPDDTLHVPGHPPVPLSGTTELDKKLWDRKGIAFVNYELPDGKKGRLRLDDFIYERKPTDEIFNRIEQQLAPAALVEPASEETRPA